ncbi:wax ester/triacylglycerol synthase family O-acyltransferase [Nocardia higoensis]|uniref:Diacylglycerol O-acyltransferase n=1 Tax=Nocardia higoensis TaxID=228599 RepID=A0ABS0D5I7_9NOCA|nr:wax ester/triacylglycerol synthase family O-acyltransferase [Nocardia higoensis]MBF6353738.1 wax ester/triacylglycerol synthase family O-acyltransferase [Nocardia higoensis]
MSELGPLDAGFLELEDTDQHVSARIGAVAIIAGTPGDRAEFERRFARRVDSNPRLRRKIRRGRWDISAPVWVPDPAFDLGHHLTWAALPRPRDEAALWELTANTMGRRLDRDHPLWHFTVVEELEGDRWAMILAAHHSMVDGVSGISLLRSICDPPTEEADTASAESTGAGTAPVDWQRLVRGGLELPLRAPGLIAQAPRAVVRTARGAVPLLQSLLTPRRGSSLNGPIGRQRRYAVARVRLDEIDRVRKALGGTINDVALTAVTSALRAVLLARGEQPGPESARVLTPVSTRSAQASGRWDNRVSLMLPALPVHLEDPLDQFAAVRGQMDSLKSGGESSAGRTLVSAAGLVPFAPMAWAVKTALRFPQQGVAALATNVPGPAQTQHLFGADILEVFPFAPIAMRIRIGIAMLSYAGTLNFGITGDYDGAPDIDLVARTLPAAVHRLLERASA